MGTHSKQTLTHSEASKAFGGLLALDGILGNVGLGCSVGCLSLYFDKLKLIWFSLASPDLRWKPMQEHACHLQRCVGSQLDKRFVH